MGLFQYPLRIEWGKKIADLWLCTSDDDLFQYPLRIEWGKKRN